MKIEHIFRPTKFKDSPLVFTLCAIQILSYILIHLDVIKETSCTDKNTYQSIFLNNFVHTEFVLLAFNVYGLYGLASLEITVGTTFFAYLIFLILILNTLIEKMFRDVSPDINCINTGFSGVILSLLTYKNVHNFKIQYQILFLMIFISIMNAISEKATTQKIGILTGLLLSIFFKSKRL